MKFDPRLHHRRSIRLKGYDYRQAGGYFVTMVTQGREMMFGKVVNGEMELNPAGEMIVRWWLELPNKFPNVNVDIFMPMPNHFHGVIFIFESPIGPDVGADVGADVGPDVGPDVGADLPVVADVGADLPVVADVGADVGPDVGADLRVCPDYADNPPDAGIFPVNGGGDAAPPLQRPNAPLSQMIQWFKTMTTNEYIRGVKQLGWKPFNGKLWQRNYYEHIIRNETELDRIARYIESNPARWNDDNENLSRLPKN